MRFMILHMADKTTEAGVLPREKQLAEIEIRRVYEADDFGAEFTAELREAEERMRDQIAARPAPATAAKPG